MYPQSDPRPQTARAANAVEAISKQPAMIARTDRMATIINDCHMIAHGLERGLDRLSGCRPEKADTEAAAPPADCLDTRLHRLCGALEGLAARLQDSLSRLDAQV